MKTIPYNKLVRDRIPETITMAATLAHIELKLDAIQELQQEMMGFLQDKERAKIRGNINTLVDVINNYKYNWDNETYKVNKHILVQDIRRESEECPQLRSITSSTNFATKACF